jgi:hypoxanthine phosphoribosyltransferase
MPEPSTLIEAARIADRVRALGQAISMDYAEREICVVVVLKGSFMFAADLVRAIDCPLTVDFLAVKSYEDATESSGVVRLTHDLSNTVEGKHVLLVEDIVDTGLTVRFLLETLQTRKPASLRLAALLHKPARTRTEVHIDYLGFKIEDVFVVGYGLDHAQRHRNLPFIGVVES